MTTLKEAVAAREAATRRKPCVFARMLAAIPQEDVPSVLAWVAGERLLSKGRKQASGPDLFDIFTIAYAEYAEIPSEDVLMDHRNGKCAYCRERAQVAA